MKIIYRCAECGELLTVAAGEVKGNGDALFHVQPHKCFPETEAATGEPSGRPWDAWPPPAREITPDGLAGIAPNTCMLCGTEVTHTGRNSLGEDIFSCPAGNCGVEFKETGTGPELLPCEFGEGERYHFICAGGTPVYFEVIAKDHGFISISDGLGRLRDVSEFLIKDGDSEYFIVPEALGGRDGDRVYPYCKVS